MSDYYSIGEFSRITGLTVKTIRFYHEEGLLAPAFVDPGSGYRYYGPSQAEIARVISFLRKLEFPVEQIREILRENQDDADLLEFMDRHRGQLVEKIRRYRDAERMLRSFLESERQARTMSDTEPKIEEKKLAPMLIAGVRMKGCYGDCGKGFAKIGKSFGWNMSGKPMLLHFSTEYREGDADFEACIPVSKAKDVEGISVRELPAGRCVALLHKGPYDELGRSYEKITKYIHEKGYKIAIPSREVYIKGPGMIFKGNPNNYLTEIQMVIEE